MKRYQLFSLLLMLLSSSAANAEQAVSVQWPQVKARIQLQKDITPVFKKELGDHPSIKSINTWVNKTVKFKAHDPKNVWQTPYETLTKGGDCEDYALLKWFIIKYYHLEKEPAKMTVLYDKFTNQHHMILFVNGQYLDNQEQDIYNEVLTVRYNLLGYLTQQ
jgi:predicted transglutaminase-like cysteine proteinase